MIEYNFVVNNKIYKNQYQYEGLAPIEDDELIKFFTVHYFENNPNNNYLNITKLINDIHIPTKSTLRIIGDFTLILILLLILLYQILILVKRFLEIDKPLETPDYLKK